MTNIEIDNHSPIMEAIKLLQGYEITGDGTTINSLAQQSGCSHEKISQIIQASNLSINFANPDAPKDANSIIFFSIPKNTLPIIDTSPPLPSLPPKPKITNNSSPPQIESKYNPNILFLTHKPIRPSRKNKTHGK